MMGRKRATRLSESGRMVRGRKRCLPGSPRSRPAEFRFSGTHGFESLWE